MVQKIQKELSKGLLDLPVHGFLVSLLKVGGWWQRLGQEGTES